ncbi:hypothetical protein [Yanshouia hominis]|uniref:Uncharacterized protein n=1 Tax=Yanshouia hominis TaxID=2763673 RepID=A0ABR7NMX2_9FIRM|nr:hypothetical protein [Yanshouia hominis]MBC8577743.1 hypothetical protein [Yanshouia hominis]
MYEQVSQGNEFIDFEYVREYSGSTDRSSVEQLASKAEGFLLKNDALHVNMKKLDLTDENMADDIDENGKVKPVFQVAYTEDFNEDGESESFFIVNMPKSDPPAGIRSYLFFADRGEVELVNEYFYASTEKVSLLDYGSVKHLIIGGEGTCGADSHTFLCGVKDDKARLYYDFRGEYIKYKCFLSTYGWQGMGDLMYYDTVAEEYRIIVGKEIGAKEILALDSDNLLSDYEDYHEQFFARLIGGKYYLISRGAMDSGIPFVYENGALVRVEEPGIRTSGSPANSEHQYVMDIDMEKAEAGMKRPESR